MSFMLYKNLPAGESKFEWYSKLSNAVVLFAPKNSRYVVIGAENAILFKFNEHFIFNHDLDEITGRYLLGKIGLFEIYVDPYYTDQVTYEVRNSKEDLMNRTDTSMITGRIVMEEK